MTSQWYDKLQRIWPRPRFAAIGLGLLAVCLIFVTSNWMLSNLTRSHPHKVTLSFVVPNNEAQPWQSLIDEFETAHPKIAIDLVNLRDQDAIKPQDPRAVKKQYIDSFNQENPLYDLVFMDIIWVPEFAKKQWIRDLPMQPTDPELKKFLSDDVKGGIYQNKLYRMPVRSDIGWLYYRTDLLKDAGLKPPETFEELIDSSQKLQAKELRWGYLWQGRQSEALSAMFVEVLHGYGGFWINEKLDVGLDRTEAIAAVQFLHDTMFDQNPISPKTLTTYREDETLKLFLEGKAAFLRNWSNVLPRANLTDSNIRNKIGVKPMVHTSGYTSGGCQGGWGLGIAQRTQHPEEAWQAVQFFTSAAAQRKLFLAASDGLPTRRELFKDSQLVKRYSHYPAILDFFENQKPHPIVLRPAISQYAQATCILQKYLHTALTQENPEIERKMQDAARDTRILLKTIEGTPNEKGCIFDDRG
ncbi:ABC transporter substrate-binding protein [Phormidesmis priestleyi ULC007]|uniref:ABC transporter substrate-binding protein n=1 Tax=Phormidesmis priestleyi ULC007 TaxID=1920490 RepID=A0A2T1DIP1_9CYAN|nr:extracellular solute-binding protein [Phormidesmis priestleyi]PSB20379.1 ABC transporter substrate-binding protein [Phormidesmis priestleyi ULC007]PZO52956.1 MAG: ABC transporter substrate-binding protein [Phormidesmis priestleyi]